MANKGIDEPINPDIQYYKASKRSDILSIVQSALKAYGDQIKAESSARTGKTSGGISDKTPEPQLPRPHPLILALLQIEKNLSLWTLFCNFIKNLFHRRFASGLKEATQAALRVLNSIYDDNYVDILFSPDGSADALCVEALIQNSACPSHVNYLKTLRKTDRNGENCLLKALRDKRSLGPNSHLGVVDYICRIDPSAYSKDTELIETAIKAFTKSKEHNIYDPYRYRPWIDLFSESAELSRDLLNSILTAHADEDVLCYLPDIFKVLTNLVGQDKSLQPALKGFWILWQTAPGFATKLARSAYRRELEKESCQEILNLLVNLCGSDEKYKKIAMLLDHLNPLFDQSQKGDLWRANEGIIKDLSQRTSDEVAQKTVDIASLKKNPRSIRETPISTPPKGASPKKINVYSTAVLRFIHMSIPIKLEDDDMPTKDAPKELVMQPPL